MHMPLSKKTFLLQNFRDQNTKYYKECYDFIPFSSDLFLWYDSSQMRPCEDFECWIVAVEQNIYGLEEMQIHWMDLREIP